MQEIISPVSPELLKEELARVRFIRPTCKAGNLIYDFTAHEAPNLMREVGRLREIAFRQAGGGTGKDCDIDELDIMAEPYHQLIVWDPENEAVVGGYRWIDCLHVPLDDNGQPMVSSSHLFKYSEQFLTEYFPHTIELGRAFVQPVYQTREMGSRSLFALDNLWDGLGAIIYQNKHIRYLLGKVTLYPSFEEKARNLIYAYLEQFNKDKQLLAVPHQAFDADENGRIAAQSLFTEASIEENFKLLLNTVRQMNTVVPPLFVAYLHLCPTLRYFGNAANDEFGDVYETGIMVPLDEIDSAKRDRHIGSFERYLAGDECEKLI